MFEKNAQNKKTIEKKEIEHIVNNILPMKGLFNNFSLNKNIGHFLYALQHESLQNMLEQSTALIIIKNSLEYLNERNYYNNSRFAALTNKKKIVGCLKKEIDKNSNSTPNSLIAIVLILSNEKLCRKIDSEEIKQLMKISCYTYEYIKQAINPKIYTEFKLDTVKKPKKASPL